MSVAEAIERKLNEALMPLRLSVQDDSQRHFGHAGYRPEGETHFRVEVVSAAFEGQSRVERHRTVMTILAEEMAGPVHALELKARTPGEDG